MLHEAICLEGSASRWSAERVRAEVPDFSPDYDDMYVEQRFAEQTANLIQGTKFWLTNELVHSALRMDGEKVFSRLLAMLRGDL